LRAGGDGDFRGEVEGLTTEDTESTEEQAMDPAAAKQFLISKILQEADVSHVPLPDVERKMLHFTEQHSTLPDLLGVNAQFESECNAEEYEAKIANLLRSARERDEASANREQEWNDAIEALRQEDHYILVMVGQAFGRGAASQGHRLRDYVIYIAVGVSVVLAVLWWSAKH
jgi:hypothetical protein